MVYLVLLIALSFALAAASPSITKRQDGDWQETIIFLKKRTNFGQDVFIRGGVGNGKGCLPDALPEDDPCAIPIAHLDLEIETGTPQRDDWADSDMFLTWGGRENGQDVAADGTPAQWTTSNQRDNYFHELNTYGNDYWMVHVEMDCSKVGEDGFFDIKGMLNGQWERDIYQSSCRGDAAKTPNYRSKNHIARCGYVNVFEWGSSRCRIESF